MTINIYQIAKNDKDEYEPIINNFIKMSKKYANVKVHNMFNKSISKAQTIGQKEAYQSYSDVFEPKMQVGYNIALDVLGKKMDSFEFSELLHINSTVNFTLSPGITISTPSGKVKEPVTSVTVPLTLYLGRFLNLSLNFFS